MALRRISMLLHLKLLIIILLSTSNRTTTTASPPPPPPTTTTNATSTPPAIPTRPPPPPPPPTGTNAYRDGIVSAFNALGNYSIMKELYLDMDLSWMDSARPLTAFVFQDGPALDHLFNANTFGTLQAGPLKMHVLPNRFLMFGDMVRMTDGGRHERVATMLANRSVDVSRQDNVRPPPDLFIFIDEVLLTDADVFVSPDNLFVAHGIALPLPAANLPGSSVDTPSAAPPLNNLLPLFALAALLACLQYF